VTLTRLLLSWVLVTVAFMIIDGLGLWFSTFDTGEPRDESKHKVWMFTKWDVLWRSAEALAVTLFASLWFDSLGHGGWWLLFSLLGLIVAFARLQDSTAAVLGTSRRAWERREAVVQTIREAFRYVLAGAILAWRLG
jgi:hypothetical protein